MKRVSISGTLGSLRLTIFLMVSLIAIFMAGLLIPQKETLGKEQYLLWKAQRPGLVAFLESSGLTDVYSSPVTLAVWGLFFINLTAVMTGRIPELWARCRKTEIPPETFSPKGRLNWSELKGVNLNDAEYALRKKGYAFFPEKDGFRAVKNRFSPLLTIAFHLSFIIILAGGVAGFYTKFRGGADVSEGETFTGDYRWIKKPKIGEIPRASFTVVDVRPVYFGGDVPVSLEVDVISGGKKKTISVNNPLMEGSTYFVITDIDVSPLFVIRDERGVELDGAYLKLKGLKGEEDSFEMLGYEFKTEFFTDIFSEGAPPPELESGDFPFQVSKNLKGGERRPRKREITNPAFGISVLKKQRLLARKILRPGETIAFENKHMRFEDLRYWVMFYAAKEHGTGAVYAGFGIAAFSLAARFLLRRREIFGVFKEGSLYMAGRAEFFDGSFEEEIRRLINGLP